MRKILLSFFVFLPVLIFSQDSGYNITKDWILIKQKSRSYFEKRKLLEMDTQTLDELDKKPFSPDVEDVLADFLYEVIVFNKVDNVENSIKALDILQNKFKDKSYLFKISSEFADGHAGNSPFVIAKILLCLKNTITGNYDQNVTALYKVYERIKTPYIVEAKNGTVRYGTNTVIKFLKEYLDEFPILLKQGKIDPDPKKLDTVLRITAEAGI